MDPSLVQNKIQMINNNNIGQNNILLIMKSYSSDYSVSSSISSSYSCMGLFELVQPDPLQLPQAGEHFTQCFLHVDLILLQSVWQLHLIIFRSSSGGKSVSTGITLLPSSA